MKFTAAAVIAVCVLLGTSDAPAQSLQDGVTFLLQNQSTDGAFGQATGEDPTISTAETLSAFGALGLGTSQEAQSAEIWLSSSTPGIDNELRLRTGLTLGGTLFSTPFSPEEHIAPFFEQEDALNQALSLRWAAAAQAPDTPALVAMRRALSDAALTSGCYGIADNGDSVALTSEVVLALRSYSWDPWANAALQSAVACLESKQQWDGSFGDASNTALAVLALMAATGNHAAAVSQAQFFLSGLQQSDGSWEESTRTTALVVQALGTSAPDWRVPYDEFGRPVLALNDPEPIRGASIQVRLGIENRASLPAPAIPVRFTAIPENGSPAVVLGEFGAPTLVAGASYELAVSLPTANLAGRYSLQAEIDPYHSVDEIDEFNNIAAAPLNVRTANDLAIGYGGIQFSGLTNGHVRIDAQVHNLGSALTVPIDVDFYKGSPSSGAKLGSATVPAGVNVNEFATASYEWDPSSANGPTAITVVIDPLDAIAEADEQNNRSFRYFYPGSTQPVDLALSTADILTPVSVTPGEAFTANLTVHNASSFDANRVQVGGYDYSTGALLFLAELPMVPAQGVAVLQQQVQLPRNSSFTLRVVVDPQKLLSDSNRNNNTALRNVSVESDPPVELEVGTVSPTDYFAANGDQVDLRFTVKNTGTALAQTTLRIVDRSHGDQVWGEQPVSLGPKSSTTITVGPYTTDSDHTVLVGCLDPDAEFTELNENNNCGEIVLGAGSADVRVYARDIQVSPIGPNIGEKVTVTADITNASTAPASAVVEFWHGVPGRAGAELLAEEPVSMPASGTGSVSYDWIRSEGAPEIHIRAAQVVPRDPVESNNVTGRHLFLEEMVDLPPTGGLISRQTSEIRVGSVTGNVSPDVVLGYTDYGLASKVDTNVALLTRGSGGSLQPVWTRPVLTRLADVAIADLDSDDEPEIIALSSESGALPVPIQLAALHPDGSTKWEVSTLRNSCAVPGPSDGKLSFGDVNADGVSDVLYVDRELLVFSGADGSQLLSVPVLSQDHDCTGDATSVVLDTDGNGTNEILVADQNNVVLFDSAGNELWRESSIFTSQMSIVDLDLDGNAEIILPIHRNYLRALDARTGATVQEIDFESYATWPASAGDFRQQGLPSFSLGNNGFNNGVTALSADFTRSWVYGVPDTGSDHPFRTLLADLVGQGRPQVIAASPQRPFVLLDARTGQALVDAPTSVDAPKVQFHAYRQPVIAEVTGDAHADILVHPEQRRNGDVWNVDGTPEYAPAALLIFGSVHWQDLPSTWPTRTLVRGQFGDDLKPGNDYRWWTTHNTWNQQFDTTPVTLMADLVIDDSDLSAAPTVGAAGDPVQLVATIHNLGGLPAPDSTVSFYDGDPDDGGVLLGEATATGPIQVRGGTSTATLTWKAYPEGEHLLFVKVNANGAVPESGDDNNTASFGYFVGPGTQLCELALDAATITASPSQPLAGDSVTLSATVRNDGAVDCAATQLSIYDGPVAAGGTLASSAAIPLLGPGASVVINASLLATPGTHDYRLIADETFQTLDGNRTDNEAAFTLFVPASQLPDLAVANLALNPAVAYPGEAVSFSATVRNLGAAVMSSTPFTLSSGGAIMFTGTLPPVLAGETVEVSGTANVSPPATLSLAVDPDGSLLEFDETNNVATKVVGLIPPELTLTASANPNPVGADQAISLDATLVNTASSAREFFLTGVLEASDGQVLLQPFTSARRVVAAGATTSLSAVWNSGSATPGTYTFEVIVEEGNRNVARSTAPLVITPDIGALTEVVTEEGTYGPNDEVVILQRTSNLSHNAPLAGSTLDVRIADAIGTTLYQSHRNLPELGALAHFDSTDVFSISPQLPPGTLTVTTEVQSSSGVTLSVDATTFDVAYPAVEVVHGTIAVTSPFGIGSVLPVTVDLTNEGSTAITQRPLSVYLLDAETLVTESLGTVPVTLSPAQVLSVPIPIPTAGVGEGEKLLIAVLDGRTLDKRVALAIAQIDTDPPLVLISGVSDGLVTKVDVTPEVTVEDQSPVQTAILLDGLPFAVGATISSEGDHTFEVESQDAYGNLTALVLSFTIDKKPPALSLMGPADGAVVQSPASLVFAATDDHLDSVSSTLDGIPIASGQIASSEGAHLWSVTASDTAGNTVSELRAFVIDATSPEITISGVADGDYLGSPVAPVVTVTDLHLDSVEVLLDGQSFLPGTTIASEGAHVLEVTATDAALNAEHLELSFVIDLTLPAVEITGVAEGAILNVPVTLQYQVTDVNLETTSALLDGQPFASGTLVTNEGTHHAVVAATDKAQNSAQAEVHFTIDLTPPQLVVSGVSDGQFLNTPPVISWSAQDANPGATTAVLDGASIAQGSLVTAEGSHQLEVTSVDLAGNMARFDADFVVDLTSPVVTITGVANGARGLNFAPEFFASDLWLDHVDGTLDGQPFQSGTLVDTPGLHVLTVSAVDLAGNVTVESVTFEILDLHPSLSFAVCAMSELELLNNGSIGGPSNGHTWAATNGSSTILNNGFLSGDLVSGGAATLGNNAAISGTLYAGAPVSIANHATVGQTSPIAPAPMPCECGFELPVRFALVQGANDNAALQAEPAISSHLVQGGLELHNASATLPAGTFVLSHLKLSGQSTLSVAPGGDALVYVSGAVEVKNSSHLGTALGGTLTVISAADAAAGEDVVVQQNADATAQLYAPAAEVILSDNAFLRGAAVGLVVRVENNARIEGDATSGPPPLVCQ